MNGITEFFNGILRTLLRLVLIAAAAIFIFSLLLATLVVLAGVTIWSLLTGRKPDAARVFGQFRQTSARYTRGAWPGNNRTPPGPASRGADIVDIPAHEVRDVSDGAKPGHDEKPGSGRDPMARVLH
jgi:hypothetical protein